MRRRALLAAGLTLAAPAVLRAQAPARLKFANIMPATHPLNTRMAEASATIKQATDGRVDIALFPASQLGTDGDMLSQFAQRRHRPVRAIRADRGRAGAAGGDQRCGVRLRRLRPGLARHGTGALGQAIIAAFDKANLVAFDRVWG